MNNEKPMISEKYMEFYKEAMHEGEMPWKTKELIAMAVALGYGCKPCYQFHLERAKKAGATRDEIRETLAVAQVVLAGTVRGISGE
ncbi:MAG TPA: carboxymuconolactone decarboxylase family protein [Caldisericia bacterium]|jgi:AhpD family alkylhydroperoxidase|nr:carboxymuconolactone decarboxylase family protein [Caldisericia bacterium]